MKSCWNKTLSILLVTVLCSLFASCNGDRKGSPQSKSSSKTGNGKVSDTESKSNDTVSSNKKVDPISYKEPMDVSIAVMTGFTQSDSRVEKMLEKKYNVNINLVVLPGWTDGQSKVSLFMAGHDMPDIMWWWGMDNEFLQWRDADLLVDVSKYLNKYTNIRDYYNKMDPKTLFYATEDDGAIYRIPGDVAEPSCECLWIRQDWLDNLNLKVPTTIQDLEEVMRAFTEDDPDGNGKKDTYGLGGAGNDFRSFWPWIQGYDYTHYDRFSVDDQGKVIYGPSHGNTKKWLAEVAKLYDKGYITPNITQTTDRDEEMANGGFGVTYNWCAYNNPDSQTMISFYDSNPNAKWVPIDMVKGKNGNPQEDPATSSAWCYFGITKAATDPERLYAIYDDMCSLDNYIERRYGVEGEDYTFDKDGVYQPVIGPESEENNTKNIGLNLFHNLFNRKDEGLISNTPETKALFKKSGENSRDRAAQLIEWKNPASLTEWVDCRTDIEDEKNRYMWGVIAGTESIKKWDNYIATLDSLGLQDVLEEAQKVYNAEKEKMEDYMSNKVNQK
jgi:putative aldouronate transport system substrate-binding protein